MKFYETGETRMFNLADDLGETRNLVRSKARKAEVLEAKLVAYLAEIGAQMPVQNPAFDPATDPAG